MFKFIIGFCVLLFLGNCAVPNSKYVKTEDGNYIVKYKDRISKVELEGHEYWIFTMTGRGGITHSVSCPAKH